MDDPSTKQKPEDTIEHKKYVSLPRPVNRPQVVNCLYLVNCDSWFILTGFW